MAEKAENKQGGDAGAATAATTFVFKADLHCEGCAQKVKRNLRHLTGVVSVKADLVANKLTVVGNVDPTVVKQRVEAKLKKSVDLVSPQPAKPDKAVAKPDKAVGDGKKPDEKKSEKKAEEKKPKEAQVTTIVLKTDVHCDGCAKKMTKIVAKQDGVQSVNVELAKDQITIKGTMDMKEMLPYLVAKFKRSVEVSSPQPAKKGDGKEGGKSPAAAGGGEGSSKVAPVEEMVGNVGNVYKMEYGDPYYGYQTQFYNPQQAPPPEYGYVAEYGHAPPPYLPPPEMFSDENPNACSVM